MVEKDNKLLESKSLWWKKTTNFWNPKVYDGKRQQTFGIQKFMSVKENKLLESKSLCFNKISNFKESIYYIECKSFLETIIFYHLPVQIYI